MVVIFGCFLFSSRRRHTRCALVTGVQTCALPIFPRVWREPAADAPAPSVRSEVAVLGMIHDGHRKSATWGLDAVRDTITRFDPDEIGRASCRERVCQYV